MVSGDSVLREENKIKMKMKMQMKERQVRGAPKVASVLRPQKWGRRHVVGTWQWQR